MKGEIVAKVLGLVAVLVILTSVACEMTQPVESSQGTAEISYRYDTRKMLCFAMLASVTSYGHRVVSITYVPLPPDMSR